MVNGINNHTYNLYSHSSSEPEVSTEEIPFSHTDEIVTITPTEKAPPSDTDEISSENYLSDSESASDIDF